MSEKNVREAEALVGVHSDAPSTKLSAVAYTAVLVIPMLLTVAYGGVDYWALGLQAVLATILVAVWSMDSVWTGVLRLSRSALQIPVVAMIAIGLIQLLPFGGGSDEAIPGAYSSALTLDPFATRMALIQLVSYLVFFAAALVFIDSPKRLRRSVVVFLIFTSLMAFFGILQFLTKPEAIYGLRPTPQAEPFSAFVNKHHFAALMEMTFGVALALLIGKATGKDKRVMLWMVVVLSGIACILTGSRAGLLSLFAVGAFVLFAQILLRRKHHDAEHDRKTRGTIFSHTFSAVFGLLALVVVLVGSVILLGGDSSLTRGLGLTSQGDFSSGRLHFWAVSWNVFLSSPVIGVGLDSFALAFTRFDTWPGVFRIEQAHNDYLQVLAEAGILGFACVGTFVVLLFHKSISHIAMMTDMFPRGAAVGALAGCFGVLLHSFFDFPLRTPANAYFFLLMAAFATVSIRFHNGHHRHRRTSKVIDQY